MTGTKILIVDDEPAIRRFLKASLEAQGFEIVAAEDGGQALAAVSHAKPELMILDLGLPDQDGIEVIRQVRGSGALQQQGLGPTFRLRELSLDFLAHRVTIGEAEVKLSKREFALLRLLAEHAGKVMTHRQLLIAVWGEAHRDDVEYLRVYVRQLRTKLGDDPANPRFIETEPGVGYRLKAE
jgi:two-component system, OmpR family, KDP operon response regulator KdpE